jgi:hypothetical protein
MLSIADIIGHPHKFYHFFVDVSSIIQLQVMDEESVGQIFYAVKARIVVIGFCQYEMNINKISTDFVD